MSIMACFPVTHHEFMAHISSDIRMIITVYRIKKISDDHPYIWRYTARRALMIFDHPYNAHSVLPEPVSSRGREAPINQICTGASVRPLFIARRSRSLFAAVRCRC